MPLRALDDLIDGFAARGDAPAIGLHEGDGRARHWSYAELADQTLRAASGLRQSGVADGDVVGLLAPNGPDWLAAFLGIVRAGAIAMPLAEQITDQELGRIVEHSGCRRLITTAGHARSADSLREHPDLELVLLDAEADADDALERPFRSWHSLISAAPEPLPGLAPEQNAALLYTSGTTGTPKGVPLTHSNLCSNVAALLEAELATPADRILLPLPFYHAYPLTVGLLAPLAIGASVVTPAGISGPQVTAALREHRCTIMIAVPRLYEAMVAGIERRMRGVFRRPFEAALGASIGLRRRFGVRVGRVLFRPLHRRLGPDLRLVASGGSRLDPEVAWRLEGLGFEVLTGYGLTETAPILTFNPPGQARIDTAGRPMTGVELRVERGEGGDEAPDDDGDRPAGEILARGPNVFAGYWRNPEATRESFTDGFFRTGDLGFLDDDGYLHIVGRQKELIVLAGGKNIFPDEIETVYEQSGLIHEIGVLEHGGRLVGLVLPEAEAIRGAADTDAVHERVRGEIERLGRKLAPYQRLGDVAITRQLLPRTQIGKLRRHELPAIFEREKSGAGPRDTERELSAQDKALLSEPPVDRVWAWLQERFEGHPLGLDTSPHFDLGLDSFDWMSLVVELEERFGARLDEDAVARVATIRDLLYEVRAAAREPPVEEGEPSPEQARWLEPQGQVAVVLGRLLFTLDRALMRGLFRLRVEGAEHLPAGQACLIAPNHLSYLDPFALAAALPFEQLRHTYWAGWTALLFRGPITRSFSRVTRILPVDPERGLTSTLVIGRAALERGNALVWFPEGQRSRDGELKSFLPGVGWLLEKTDVPVVPVAIEGTFAAWPPERRLPRPGRLKITIGRPIAARDLLAEGDSHERHAKAADRLRARVAELGAPTGAPPRRAA